jgi:Protein of unknown function (DUF3443)
MQMQRWSMAALAVMLGCLGGCGGGGGSGGNSPPPSTPQNVQPITVDAGPASIPDIPFITITICAPGSSSNCQTIDHIEVDTGSTGLRILSSVLSASLSLPQQQDASGNPVVECVQFADGFSWGPVKMVDLRIAGEQASSLPVQIIGDPAFTSIPPTCSNSGPPENTVTAFGANGLIGIGLFMQDCGSACAQFAVSGAYYTCPTSGCRPTQAALTQQLQNPVGMFSTDNNGVLIQLPTLPATGAATATGSLIFGIGTQSNNGLGSATILGVDANTGNIATVFSNISYANSYIDSGSSAIFFGFGLYPICTGAGAGFYCPSTMQNLSATLQGINRTTSTVSFSVGNADQLFGTNPSFMAFSNIALPNPDPAGFAWGLPFFFGRNVFTALEGKNTPGGLGPYFAF